jgi:ribose transport system permease protein
MMTNIKDISNKEEKRPSSDSMLLGRIKLALILIVPYIIVNMATGGKILTVNNLSSVFTSSVTAMFMALCFCFLFTTGITDLSVGSILILASNVGGIFAVNLKLGTFGLLLGSILVSILLLLLNTVLRQLTKIPSWIFGLGAAMVYEAIGTYYGSYMISKGRQVVSLGDIARSIGRMPWNFILVIIGFIAAYLLFNKTSVGYNIRALGSNQKVAEMMGVDVQRTMIYSAILGGVFLGIAAAVNESYASRVMPVTGLSSVSLIFTALAGFLLASSLSKYVNLTLAILIGIFIISSLFNVLTILGVPSGTWQQTVMGLTVIISGIVSQRKYKGVVK